MTTIAVGLTALGICMPAANGPAVAQRLHAGAERPRIVPVTACDQHAVDAFDAEAVDFLPNPDDFLQIHRSVSVDMNARSGTRRDLAGKLFVRIREHGRERPVARPSTSRFRQISRAGGAADAQGSWVLPADFGATVPSRAFSDGARSSNRAA